MEQKSYVYILASKRNGSLYICVITDLMNRVYLHRITALPRLTRDHGIKMLVYFECYARLESAIRREKAMKKWYRNWKLELIERDNLEWRDLWSDIAGFPLLRE